MDFVDGIEVEDVPWEHSVSRKEADHPAHYNQGKVECIEALEACMSKEAFEGFLLGNAMKYLWRYKSKGVGRTDLEKAKWYLDRLIKEQ